MSAPVINWYVQYSGQNYGPYSNAQMQQFVAECRVIATSIITHDVSRGFFRASAYPIVSQWINERENAAQLANAGQMQIAVGQSHEQNAQPARKNSVFLIMAEIRSGEAMRFLQTLQIHGTAQRIGDTVWLLQAKATVDELRRSLSQTLTKQDRLFILDSFNNEKAWFNIGADMDQRIRDLWEIED